MTVTARIVKLDPVEPVEVAAADAALALIVESDSPRPLQVEVYRGATLRQRLNVCAAETHAFALTHGQGPGSPRLTCRVRLGGRPVAEASVLLAAPADNQGRLESDAVPDGDSTRLAFGAAFDRLLQRRG